MGSKSLIHGVGINDADYKIGIHKVVGDKRKLVWLCPYYVRWSAMVKRCYSPKSLKDSRSYEDVSVCEEWLTFSNFKVWMEKQDWEGKQLDKDLLSNDSKTYSPETCTFISTVCNSFIVEGQQKKSNNTGHAGVVERSKGKFQVLCNDPLKRDKSYKGTYTDLADAIEVRKKFKYKYACDLANSDHVTDSRAKEALINKYK